MVFSFLFSPPPSLFFLKRDLLTETETDKDHQWKHIFCKVHV